jgi:SAM-dependent methyltransferase
MAPEAPKPFLFDVWSLFYDLPWVQRAVYRPPHDAVIAELRTSGARRVLDVGCGTGLLASRLRRELPGTEVVGCDFSPGMLRHARARTPAAAWVQGDAGCLPFPRAAFDALVSTEAFHWFPDQRSALAEFRRVLRPGGHLLLALVNPRFAVTGRLMRVVSRVAGEPFYWPTAREIRAQMERSDFRVERQVRLFRLPGGMLFPPVLTVATARKGRSHASVHYLRRAAG